MNTAKQEVIFVILKDYADWEYAHAAAALNDGIQGEPPKYMAKTLSISKEPVCSIGGLRVLPDYDINNLPKEYAALILVGGKAWGPHWRGAEAEQIYPLVQDAIQKDRVLGAICNATVFLGVYGFLNAQKHTSNTLKDLKEAAGKSYVGEERYLHQQAVRDGKLITANRTAYMEFAKEVLLALKPTSNQNIDAYYRFYKEGYHETMRKK